MMLGQGVAVYVVHVGVSGMCEVSRKGGRECAYAMMCAEAEFMLFRAGAV